MINGSAAVHKRRRWAIKKEFWVINRTILFLCLFLLMPIGVSSGETEEQDLDEISRKLDNPLTSLWSLILEDKIRLLYGEAIEGYTPSNTLFFQPGLPIPVGEEGGKVLTIRPVFPVVTSPILDPSVPDGVAGHETGFGDIQILSLIGPNRVDGIVWGIGATFKFPTASKDILGSGKYQTGPAAMLFKLGRPWIIGTLVQHWWSYAGDDDRAETSRTDIQYIIRHSLPNAWSIGMGPTISVEWDEDEGERWTVPVGLGVTKTVRFGDTPVKLRAEVHYALVYPETLGTRWTFLFRIAPVIKSPFI